MAEMLAIAALGAFLMAWVVQTIIVVEKRKNLGSIAVNALFFLGLILFTIHSFSIADPWFIFFNSAAAVLALVNLYYIPKRMLALKRDVAGVEHFVEKEVTGFNRTYHHKLKK